MIVVFLIKAFPPRFSFSPFSALNKVYFFFSAIKVQIAPARSMAPMPASMGLAILSMTKTRKEVKTMR